MVGGTAEEATALRSALANGRHALYVEGDLHAARRHFERAYLLAESSVDAPAMAQAALGLGGLWVRERRTITSALQLEARLQHAFTLLDTDSALALRVRVRLAGEADYARGENPAILDALREARTAGDLITLAEALSVAHHCLLDPDHLGLRRALAVELTRVSVRTGRRGDLLMGLLWQTVDAYCAGTRHAGRLLGELRDHLAIGFAVSAIDVMLAIRAGRLGEAEWLATSAPRAGPLPVTPTTSGSPQRRSRPSAGIRAGSASCCPRSASGWTHRCSATSTTQLWRPLPLPPPSTATGGQRRAPWHLSVAPAWPTCRVPVPGW